MSNEEQGLPTNIVLIGEPGYRQIVWGEKELQIQSNYDSFEQVRENAENSETFQYKELVRREDVEALIKEKIKGVECHPVDKETAIKQSKVLQELLDEVQKDE